VRSRQEFVDVNVTGTLHLLEAARAVGVRAFVFTSTTSAFGRALVPAPGAPAAWISEDVAPVPKNIYGVTKTAAEDLCELFWRDHALPCLVLRTARFFPEDDDDPAARAAYAPDNLKVNELLHRRLDLQDAVDAHLLALERAPAVGFDRLILSATTPLHRDDCAALRADATAIVRRRCPGFEEIYARQGWKMYPAIERIYDNARARRVLGWQPRYDFAQALARLGAGEDFRSPLARAVGAKDYHAARR
jgi:UDP-glucose 4-epimerase